MGGIGQRGAAPRLTGDLKAPKKHIIAYRLNAELQTIMVLSENMQKAETGFMRMCKNAKILSITEA